MSDRLYKTFHGRHVYELEPVPLKPRWWEILRRLGIRKPRTQNVVPRGKAVLSRNQSIIYINKGEEHVLAQLDRALAEEGE